MDLSDLRTFLAVANAKGITSAGRELNTVQSNVTTRIKSLESDIGLPLFTRHSRGMTLTEAGHRLLPFAERLLTLSREATAAAREDGVPRGQLSIGSMETTAAVRLPAVLARYRRNCPHVKIRLLTGPTADLIEAVIKGDIDAAFVAGPVDLPAVDAVSAFDEELVLITPREMRSIDELRCSAADGLTALMFRIGCSYRQRLEQALADLGLQGYTRLELGTLDGILGCVAAGVGITVLPRSVVELSTHAENLSIHLLPNNLRQVATLLIIRRDARRTVAVERLRASVEKAEPVPPPLRTLRLVAGVPALGAEL
ncbi:LysR family transcriptional regulator [Tardiphaga sp.]|uniref:LysR family transcriptional regulator n=1 Tax=Tardiphaga sp. TaxID=1926292 RepID=UPI0025D106B7|nr:LysR family transcriptional regulator [Tardiphaga sp.]